MRAGLLGIAAAVAAAGASAAVAAAAGPPPLCTGPSVAGSFALIPGSPGAGNVVYALRLHLRRGARTCVVTGVPALRLLSRSGAPLPTRVVPARPRRGLPVRVVLRTGTWASASARFSPDVPGPGEGTIGRCEPVAHRLRVMLAGRSSLVVAVAPPTSVCSHGFLSVSALVAGRTPPGRRVAVAKVFEGIDGKLAAWILAQRMFFVGTAPAGDGGHVNVSPKGDLETFRITGPHGVAYLDFIGSGAETIAHLRENGRIVIMLCAFEGAPRIVRLHGTGRVVQLGDPGFAALVGEHGFEAVAEAEAGARAVVLVDVDRVSDSCGYGVPLMRYEGKRPQLGDWLDRTLRQGPNALMDYVREKNATSLDGLPALDAGSLPDRS